MRNRVGNVLWGCLWLAVGVLILGKVFGWWNFSPFFDGWWTLLIIIPCLIGIVKHGFSCGSTIGLVLSIMVLLSYQVPDVINRTIIWKMVLPVIFVVIGLSIIFRSIFSIKKSVIEQTSGYDKPTYAAVFAGHKIAPDTEFYGCSAEGIFGTVVLDLRYSHISNDIVINTTAIFGSVDILVPPNVNVKISSTSLFGGADNKVKRNADATATIYVSSICMFGGVDVK